MVCNVLMLWRPCAEAKREREKSSSSLAHAEWCFNYLNWNDNHPSHPGMKQIKRVILKVTSFCFFSKKPHFVVIPCCISAAAVFVHNSLSMFEISTCFMWRSRTWGRAASVPRCHDCDKTQTHKRLIRKDAVWVICVFSLFADGGPRSTSCCTSLAMLHNEYVSAPKWPKKKKNLTVHYPAF